MATVKRIFVRGLAAILPLGLTIYIVWWLGVGAESLLAPLLRRLLPEGVYFPGLGVLFGLIVVLFVGALTTTFLARWLLSLGEQMIERLPVAKTIYIAAKDTIALVSKGRSREFGQVVMVEVPGQDGLILGFITAENPNLPGIPAEEDRVAVYLPMAYTIGGYTLLLPRSSLRPVDIDPQDALRFAVTAGMSGPREREESGGQ